ncbi:MAG TPA: hypothetical protein VN655_12045 [Pseudolabrys sp.]|nr:hypothetical protein [Pseudolabrys sp.]
MINPNKAGLALGGVLGLYHLGWAVLIAFGWAQVLIDLVLWLHMIKPFVVVEAFSLGRAAGLVIFTAATGYVLGWLFAVLWNRAHR